MLTSQQPEAAVGNPLLLKALGRGRDAAVQYVEPLYKRDVVNAAGVTLIAEPARPLQSVAWMHDMAHAYAVVNNWRASHHRPLNTFYVSLNNRAKRTADDDIVAQRLKRLESITAKLSALSKMRLSQMQDIAGCRAVMPSIDAVRRLEAIYRAGGISHDLRSSKDYIAHPKVSGYRSVHLIFAYKLRRPSVYEGHKVEIQIRTQWQHAWATAVEAAGTLTNQALKSSQGAAEWQRFFALMGSYIAEMEGCPLVPNTPAGDQLKDEIRQLAAQLKVAGILRAYSATLQQVGRAAKMKYYLMDLDPDAGIVRLTLFTAAQTKEANDAYTEMEKSIPADSPRQVVLVSVASLQALRQAYPNYFLDTTRFVSLVEAATS